MTLIYFYGSKHARHSWLTLLTQFTTEETTNVESGTFYSSNQISAYNSDNDGYEICDNDFRPTESSSRSSLNKELLLEGNFILTTQHNRLTYADTNANANS